MTGHSKLDFLVCGAQKSGTTSLDSELRQHPAICLPAKKELHFFDDADRFRTERKDWSDLHVHFKHKKPGQIMGECTPIYMYWAPCMGRIHAYNPRIKIVVVLRDPVARCYSQWKMEYARGTERLSFTAAIGAELNQRARHPSVQDRVRSYIDRGLYSPQLERILNFFPRSQVHVQRSEDHWANPQDSASRLFRFLGVEEDIQVLPKKQNVAATRDAIPNCGRSELYRYFEADVARLEALLDWDLSAWKP